MPSRISSSVQHASRTRRITHLATLGSFLVLTLLPGCSAPGSGQTAATTGNDKVKAVATPAAAKPAAPTTATTSVKQGAGLALPTSDMPAGTNLPGCKPKPGRQHIFLIHGTLHSSQLSFGALAPRLARDGHCLYAVDYGALDPGEALKARKPVADNAKEVAQALDRVLAQTGQAQIDLIGFSQGGLLGFYLIRDGGFGKRIRHFTAIAPSVRGTTAEGSLRFNQAGTCPACADQHHQSAFMKTFTSRPFTLPGVKYTIVSSRDDWIVTPPESQIVREPGVRNVLVQDRLNGKTVSHVGLMYDPDAIELIASLVNEPPTP